MRRRPGARRGLAALAVVAALFAGAPALAVGEPSPGDPTSADSAIVQVDEVADEQVTEPGQGTEVPGAGTEVPGDGETGDETQEPVETHVAQIVGGDKYETLDAAIEAATDGATIELLGDATSEGMNLSKSLTIQAAGDLVKKPVLTFTDKGIALWGKVLTFKSIDVVMNGIGATPYGEWGWMTICASTDASLTLDNVNMTMDATGTSNSPHAIYFCNNNVLNVINGSNLTIKNYANDALEWDGGNGGYNVNITDSTLISDHNRSGFTGTFWVTATNSLLKVVNSRGNGSNGSNFKFVNCNEEEGKGVFFNGNGSHGLSAASLVIENSDLDANDNGMYGVTYTGEMSMNGTSTLDIYRNALENSGGGLRANNAGKTSTVAAGAQINICDNGHNGLENYGTFTFDEAISGNAATVLNITGNDERTTNGGGVFNGGTLSLPSTAVITNNHAGQTGGGICNAGTVNVPEGVQLYNNHADDGGDDIYNRSGATVSFPTVGEGWVLDGSVTTVSGTAENVHCKDAIDGWYLDGSKSDGSIISFSEDRWEAHAANFSDNYAELFDPFTVTSGTTETDEPESDTESIPVISALTSLFSGSNSTDGSDGSDGSESDSSQNTNGAIESKDVATVTGPLAIKAAHGIKPLDPSNPDDPNSPDWERSKSKTATELDENYESQVTLALPSQQEELVSDVVFVLDKSTSAELEDQIIDMLSDLSDQVTQTGAKVKVGVVIFNKEANPVLELTELNAENMSKIEAAIKTKISSGTNTHAGLLKGIDMLEGDETVADSRKYLIFASDGITYMYNEDPTAIGLQNGDKTNVFAGPDNWNTKYDTNNGPESWDSWLSITGAQIDADAGAYDFPYGGTYENYISYDDRADHAMSIDKALYLTNEAYELAASKYHCYAVKASTNADHPWASSFMSYLADGESVSFEDIQKDIYYLLDAGSEVVDVMGYGTDNLNSEYDFDFIQGAENLKLTVGGNELATTDITETAKTDDANVTSAYGFGSTLTEGNYAGKHQYELWYYVNGQDGNSDECFVWKIYVPVTNFEPSP